MWTTCDMKWMLFLFFCHLKQVGCVSTISSNEKLYLPHLNWILTLSSCSLFQVQSTCTASYLFFSKYAKSNIELEWSQSESAPPAPKKKFAQSQLHGLEGQFVWYPFYLLCFFLWQKFHPLYHIPQQTVQNPPPPTVAHAGLWNTTNGH